MNTQSWGPATVLLVALAVIVVLIGGIVVIVHPDTLTFAQYLDALKTFAVGIGLLGIGRGIHQRAQISVDNTRASFEEAKPKR